MTQRIQEIILNKWKSEKMPNEWKSEKMPNEWNKSIIYPIYKKGEKFECSNYRGTLIFNTACKILATAINNRLETYAEGLLSQEQNGFWRNRSATDKIFIMR
jgi:hypothetical protein